MASAPSPDVPPKEESRLRELFWINGEFGGSYVNMRQFSAENLGITKAEGGGVMFGIGAGLRIVFLSLGAKLRFHQLPDAFNMIQANGELLFKIPISSVDVLLGLHGGYAGVGSIGEVFGASRADPANVDVSGFNVGLDLGFDYFINNYFSLGLGVTGDFLFMQRPKSGLPPGFDQLTPEVQAEYQNSDVYRYDGKSLGFGVAGALRIGLHLGP